MSNPISPSFVRIVFGSIAAAIRAEDTASALAFADAMLGRADYAPAHTTEHDHADDVAIWRTYAIEAGRQLAEQRQKNTELMELARLAANINPFGSVENAKVRDTAIRLLGK